MTNNKRLKEKKIEEQVVSKRGLVNAILLRNAFGSKKLINKFRNL